MTKTKLWAYSALYRQPASVGHTLGMCNGESEAEAEKKAVESVMKEKPDAEISNVLLLQIKIKRAANASAQRP